MGFARARSLPALVALAALSTPAAAGEVRIDVSSNFFSPSAVSLNLGDHAVWVWVSGSHTVTSGSDGSLSGDGRFNTVTSLSGVQFSWRADVTGTVPYYCIPHFILGMTGTLDVSGSGVPVSDFRLTELEYDVAGGNDLIEIRNLGAASGDLGRYRLSVAAAASVTVPLDDVAVPAGGTIVVHTNEAGTSTATDLYLPGIGDLPAAGAVALYVPNAVNPDLSDATQIVDFLQWGAGGGPHEATADAAALWASGTFMPPVAAGHSYEFCGGPADHGVSFWSEVAVPNFGTDGMCLTPAAATTWGRVKTLYR